MPKPVISPIPTHQDKTAAGRRHALLALRKLASQPEGTGAF